MPPVRPSEARVCLHVLQRHQPGLCPDQQLLDCSDHLVILVFERFVDLVRSLEHLRFFEWCLRNVSSRGRRTIVRTLMCGFRPPASSSSTPFGKTISSSSTPGSSSGASSSSSSGSPSPAPSNFNGNGAAPMGISSWLAMAIAAIAGGAIVV